MKGKYWVILLLCVALLLGGCDSDEEFIPLLHSAEEITHAEFVDHKNGVVLCTVTDREIIAQLLDELARTPVKRIWNDPPFTYGEYLIALYGSDGTIELIGQSALGVVRDGYGDMDGWHYPKNEVFRDIFLRYAGVLID